MSRENTNLEIPEEELKVALSELGLEIDELTPLNPDLLVFGSTPPKDIDPELFARQSQKITALLHEKDKKI